MAIISMGNSLTPGDMLRRAMTAAKMRRASAMPHLCRPLNPRNNRRPTRGSQQARANRRKAKLKAKRRR